MEAALNGAITIITTYGDYGGKKQTRATTVGRGKNADKKNATTPSEQAQKDAKSKWTKKRGREAYYALADLGYWGSMESPGMYKKLSGEEHLKTLEEVLTTLPEGETVESFVMPMKANPYLKDSKKGKVPAIQFPVLAQPKLNGIRAMFAVVDGRPVLFSKKGTEYNCLTDILAAGKAMFARISGSEEFESGLIIDGELYIHGTPLNEIVSACRKTNLQTPTVKFMAFDLAIPNMPQKERLILLRRLIESLGHPSIVMTPTVVALDEAAAIRYFDKCREAGYEGAMLRNPKAFYAFGKRVSDIVKMKATQTAEFQIVDVVDTDKDPGLAIFRCKNDLKPNYFLVVPEGTKEYRKKLLDNRHLLIGRMLTVEFYDRTDPELLPFHAKGIAVRDYE